MNYSLSYYPLGLLGWDQILKNIYNNYSNQCRYKTPTEWHLSNNIFKLQKINREGTRIWPLKQRKMYVHFGIWFTNRFFKVFFPLKLKFKVVVILIVCHSSFYKNTTQLSQTCLEFDLYCKLKIVILKFIWLRLRKAQFITFPRD